MTAFLTDLLMNPFNRYCVDCTKSESTHANISYGTFICAACAGQHSDILGMSSSYVKPIFEELWDTYQLKCVALGGNQRFWDFMKEYKSEMKPIGAKYKSAEAKFFRKRHAAMIQEKPFFQQAPARNVDDYVDKGVEVTKKGAKKAEEVLTKVGGKIENKFNQWFNK